MATSESLHEDAIRAVVVLDEDAVEDVAGRTIIIRIEVLNFLSSARRNQSEQEYLGLSFFIK